MSIPQIFGRMIAIFFIATYSVLSSASGLEALENFLQTSRSGRASFTQVVTGPSREGQAGKIKTSSGVFEFLRPSRFRFTYNKPFAQSIVSDGKTLWLYDADLNQVTSRSLLQAIGSTPAAIITTGADLQALRVNFTLQELPEQAGLQWVQATPRVRDGQLQNVRVALKLTATGSTLAALEILDAFGQRSVMTFEPFEANPPLPRAHFEFHPPAGASVSKQ